MPSFKPFPIDPYTIALALLSTILSNSYSGVVLGMIMTTGIVGRVPLDLRLLAAD